MHGNNRKEQKKMESAINMKELTKKVVILNNFSSPYVSQAIVVLKDYNPKLESKAIADAEQIVGRYIERIQKNGQPKAARKKGRYLKIIIGLVLAVTMCIAIKYLS